MIIITKMFNLKKGTMITTPNGVIELTSDYDSFHGWYEVKYFDLRNGELVETGEYGYKTPVDLIGSMIRRLDSLRNYKKEGENDNENII